MDTRVKGNLHVKEYIYKNCESDFYDTIGDCREYSLAGVTYQQKCTLGNVTKGAGTWTAQTGGGGATDITDLTNSSGTQTAITDSWFFQLWVSGTTWYKVTWASIKTLLIAIFAKKDLSNATASTLTEETTPATGMWIPIDVAGTMKKVDPANLGGGLPVDDENNILANRTFNR